MRLMLLLEMDRSNSHCEPQAQSQNRRSSRSFEEDRHRWRSAHCMQHQRATKFKLCDVAVAKNPSPQQVHEHQIADVPRFTRRARAHLCCMGPAAVIATPVDNADLRAAALATPTYPLGSSSYQLQLCAESASCALDRMIVHCVVAVLPPHYKQLSHWQWDSCA